MNSMKCSIVGFVFFRPRLTGNLSFLLTPNYSPKFVKIMKTFGLFFISLLLGTTAVVYGQSTVSGRVTDSSDKTPLEYATVIAKHRATGEIAGGTITNQEGRYTLNDLKNGAYVFTFSYVGYKTGSIDVLIGTLNNNYDLGEIALVADPALMTEVVITGKADIVSGKLEKQTYNMDANISQSGGSVLEAMRNLPGITIDNEGKVLLRGSDKVLILIDGRQSSLTGFGNQKGLDNLSASNIEKIEIVNNPSAKYDAQGMAGIINIIYRKEQRTGFNGDISFNFGIGELFSRKSNLTNIMDKYSFTPKYNPAVILNYRTEKVNLFLQSSGMFRRKVNCNEFTYRTYNDGTPDINSQFLENRSQQQYDIKFGFDWFIGENDQFTLFALFEDEYHIDRGHVPYDNASDGTRKRFWTWAEDERTWALNYSANYRHKFAQAGHQLEASFIYTHGVEDELFPFTDSTALRDATDKTHLVAKEKIANFAVDYVKPLFSGRLEAGTKVQVRNIPITYHIFPGVNSILDANLGEWSEYRENIYALYANYIFESHHIDIEAGLRAEDAFVKYRIDPASIYYNRDEAYDKFSLFPNIRFTFRINAHHKFSLFYNRRVDRPGEFDLRPFPKYDDPEILKTGNPYLRPQFTQLYEIAYKAGWKGGSLYLSGYYKQIDDIFTRIYTTGADPEIVNTITQNLGNGQNYGTEIIVEQQVTQKWNINAGFNWYRNMLDAFNGVLLYPSSQPFSFEKARGNTWNLKLNTAVKLPKEFDVQATYIYYAPDIIPQGEVNSRGSFDLGIRKKAFGGKAEFTLSATDIFNTFAQRQTITGSNVVLRKENYYETQVVTVGMKYKF